MKRLLLLLPIIFLSCTPVLDKPVLQVHSVRKEQSLYIIELRPPAEDMSAKSMVIGLTTMPNWVVGDFIELKKVEGEE